MARYPIGAAVLSFLLTITCLTIFKKMSVPIAVGAGLLSGAALVFWFAKVECRAPEKNEVNRIYLIYAALSACCWLGVPLLTGHHNRAGLLLMGIYALVYPYFLSVIFRRKAVEDLLKRNS